MIKIKSIAKILGFNVFMLTVPLQAETVFRAGFPHIQPDVDAGKVQSAEQYILLIHLLRSLTTYTNNGEVIGDLADSWKISPDFKSYTFKIKQGQKFSNGEEITASEAVDTIKKRMAQSYAIHYDFSNIETIKQIDKYNLRIDLRRPDPFLIYELDHPEFRPLHKSDLDGSNKSPMQITSGYYFIKERTATGFNLQANPHSATKIEGPESVSLNYLPKSDNPKADTERFLKADFDLIWSPRLADIDPLLSKGYDTHHPRLGFTFFASLNSDTVDQQNRSYIQKLLNPNGFTYKDSWRKKPAFQLYLPNGPGRISDKEAEKMWADIAKTPDPKVKKKQLTILLPSAFELTDAVNEKLRNAGYQTVLKKYRDFTEYANEIRTNTYDIVFANNDFSSIDLRGNIAVTFNPERPLILTSKKNPQISNIVNGIVKETNYETRNSIIKDLGKSLISDAYIIPIYYHEVLVLTKPGLDLSAWSQIVPEIGIWKVKKLKN